MFESFFELIKSTTPSQILFLTHFLPQKVRYQGMFNSPPYTVFDRSDDISQNIEVTLGNGMVMPIWEEFIMTMRRYEISILVAASEHCK